MNSAAVIGRQLRQQNTGRVSGPLVPPTPQYKGRPRTPSHQPLRPHSPLPPVATVSSDGKQGQDKNKKKGKEKPKTKITLQCIWAACKALSGGLFLILVGTAMVTVGFYSERLSTTHVQDGNSTSVVVDKDRQYHLHNLTFVGPVIMGLGGILIVAACVLTFEVRDTSGAKVVPMKGKRPSGAEFLLTDQVPDGLALGQRPKEARVPMSLGLPLTTLPPISAHTSPASSIRDKGGGRRSSGTTPSDDQQRSTSSSCSSSRRQHHQQRGGNNGGYQHQQQQTKQQQHQQQQTRANGPSQVRRPMLPLSSITSPTSTTNLSHLLSPQIEDFLPSPLDIILPDPEGCSCPSLPSRQSSITSMSMELYLTDCPVTVRIQVEPKLFASIESDGLSESEESQLGDPATAASSSSDRFAHCSSRCDRDLEEVDAEAPLLGRAVSFSSRAVLHNDVKGKRFPLRRQSAVEGQQHHHRDMDGIRLQETST